MRTKALIISLALGVALTLFVLAQVEEIKASAFPHSGGASVATIDPYAPDAPDGVTTGLIGH